jgi:hypothetical protein
VDCFIRGIFILLHKLNKKHVLLYSGNWKIQLYYSVRHSKDSILLFDLSFDSRHSTDSILPTLIRQQPDQMPQTSTQDKEIDILKQDHILNGFSI